MPLERLVFARRRIHWALFVGSPKTDALFENDGRGDHLYCSSMSGNPVKIGDGYATVTGYKLPMPLIDWIGKAGARFKPEVRIPIELCSSGCCSDGL